VRATARPRRTSVRTPSGARRLAAELEASDELLQILETRLRVLSASSKVGDGHPGGRHLAQFDSISVRGE